MNKVTCDLPLQGATTVRQLPYIQDLSLADPTFDKPGMVDVLIGRDAWQDVMKPETRQGNSKQPITRNTIFRWAIIGRYVPDSTPPHPLQAPVALWQPVRALIHSYSSFGRLKKSPPPPAI